MSADCGVWAAPGRVNLIGEHTDYNNGFVLPIALPLTTRAQVSLRPEPGLAVESTRGTGDWIRYVQGVVWAFTDAGFEVPGLDIAIDSDVPIGAGLSSSAALEAAVALAINDLGGFGLSRLELARLAQRAENEYVGVPCGLMDQAASLMCTSEHALFMDLGAGAIEQIPFVLQGLSVLVIDTRVAHALSDGHYADRRTTCEAAAAALGVPSLREATELTGLHGLQLKRARHVLSENQRVLDVVARLRAGDVESIGPFLTQSHVSLRDDYEVSCPELDLAVVTALEAGALGARMTGGGFGGCAIALIHHHLREGVVAAVSKAFESRGFTAPDFFDAVAGPGAHRVSAA